MNPASPTSFSNMASPSSRHHPVSTHQQKTHHYGWNLLLLATPALLVAAREAHSQHRVVFFEDNEHLYGFRYHKSNNVLGTLAGHLCLLFPCLCLVVDVCLCLWCICSPCLGLPHRQPTNRWQSAPIVVTWIRGARTSSDPQRVTQDSARLRHVSPNSDIPFQKPLAANIGCGRRQTWLVLSLRPPPCCASMASIKVHQDVDGTIEKGRPGLQRELPRGQLLLR